MPKKIRWPALAAAALLIVLLAGPAPSQLQGPGALESLQRIELEIINLEKEIKKANTPVDFDILFVMSLEISLKRAITARAFLIESTLSPEELKRFGDEIVDDRNKALAAANLALGAGPVVTGETPQPTEPVSVLIGERPAQTAPSTRFYILNIAGNNLDSSGQFVDGPMTVDFLKPDDFAYDARVDIEAGLGSNASFEPWDMAMTRDGTLLVVAARGSDALFDPRTPIPPHLTLIDTAGAQVLRHVNLPAQFLLHSLALAPDGSFAFVAASELDQSQSGVAPAVANTVLVVDLRSNAVVERIDLPLPAASAMGETVITPDGALLFVKGPSGISVIDTRTRTITATISGFPAAARHLAMDPHGAKVYVADVFVPAIPGDPSQFGIAVIDVATATRTEVIRVPKAQGGSRQDLGITGTGRVISHIDSLSRTWTIFDATTYDVVTQVDLGGPVFRAAIAH